MNIALIHDWITNLAGAERVLLNLAEFYPDAPIFTSVYQKNDSTWAFSNKKIITSYLQNIPLVKNKRELLIPLTPFAFEQFDLSEYEIVISSCTMSSKGVITKPKTKHICYCHTPPRYLWEPHLDNRAQKGLFQSLRQNTIHNLRIWDRLAADRVDYFVANSKYISDRIKKYYHRDSVVVYPPVDIDRYNLVKKEEIADYYLFVSRLVSYKKCDLVIEAFNQLKLPLKIIGRGPDKKRLQKIADPNIEFLGYLSDLEIARYYQKARAFIFMAEEDFGIVPLEAMASGRPVIAYRGGGVVETVIDGVTGLLFDQQNKESLIEAVNCFNPDQFDPEQIRQHSEKFSKQNFKLKWFETFESIVR